MFLSLSRFVSPELPAFLFLPLPWDAKDGRARRGNAADIHLAQVSSFLWIWQLLQTPQELSSRAGEWKIRPDSTNWAWSPIYWKWSGWIKNSQLEARCGENYTLWALWNTPGNKPSPSSLGRQPKHFAPLLIRKTSRALGTRHNLQRSLKKKPIKDLHGSSCSEAVILNCSQSKTANGFIKHSNYLHLCPVSYLLWLTVLAQSHQLMGGKQDQLWLVLGWETMKGLQSCYAEVGNGKPPLAWLLPWKCYRIAISQVWLNGTVHHHYSQSY